MPKIQLTHLAIGSLCIYGGKMDKNIDNIENKEIKESEKKVKILLAEDHRMTAKLISAIIDRSGTCKVIGVAQNGREVIDFARRTEVDVIIMDINMPFVDGISAMEEIFGFNKHIKIIILSGHTEAWIIKKSLNEGASGYITKLTDLDLVVDAIMTVSRGGAYLDQFSMNLLVDDYEMKTV